MSKEADYFMHMESERLKSFKKWPFKTGSCSPAKMAAAGFYHCPTPDGPDACKCFICFKELEGWEKNDDPWEEHKNHSSQCPFLNFDKPIEKFTVEEFIRLSMQIEKNRVMKQFSALKKDIEENALSVQESMEAFRA